MATISLRMDDALKSQLEEFCDEMGMNTTTFFMIYAKRAIRERRIPFLLDLSVKRPLSEEELTDMEWNEKHERAYKQAMNGKGTLVEDFFKEMEQQYGF